MSWQAASFLVLAAVLLGGFAWYERSRPPAQVVALVAALAALAIAGRIAFAAFPNVKPTTDIVIFAGYALGGAPGFAVGALAALVSNFWFGQGPWTPWQMVGWGLCGMLGAALALCTRNVGRLALAATCGLAGVLYGALLNFSLMATYGGDLSWERFWLLASRAIPFDAAHVAGNVAFALIAGPAMVRMLVRFRERFEWGRGPGPQGGSSPGPDSGSRGARAGRGGSRRARAGISTAAVLVLLLALLAPAGADASRVSRAADWLVAEQNADGGWGASPERDSGPEMTAWAMLGLAAAGRNPLDVERGGRSPVTYLRGHLDELDRAGDYARTIVALNAAGVDPRDFGGRNLVKRLLAKRREDGSYLGWPGSTAFAVIALRTAGATASLARTLEWLRSVQNEDGGWGDTPGKPSNADVTGLAMQAFAAGSKPSKRAVTYLTNAQRKGGGYPLGGANGIVNSQSTAWAVEGIRSAGRDPDEFRRGGVSAPEYLAERQQSDGHYRYSSASDQTPIWVTAQVLVAATGKHYPVAAPKRAPQPAPGGTRTGSGGSGSGGDIPAPAPAPPPSTGSAAPPLEAAGGSPGGAAAGSGSGGSAGTAGGAGPGAAPDTPAPAPGSPGLDLDDFAPRERGAETAPEAQGAAAAAESEEDSSSVLGSILLGLLAGALLVGAGLGARRGWMRWRYGI